MNAIPAHVALNAALARFRIRFRRESTERSAVYGQRDGVLRASAKIGGEALLFEGMWGLHEQGGEYRFCLRAYGSLSAHSYTIEDELRFGPSGISLASHCDNLLLERFERTDDDNQRLARWAKGATDSNVVHFSSEIP